MIISGYLRRLQRRGQNLDPEQMRALATTEAETHRITRMLNDLLDLSRSESGQLQMVLGPVAVDEVLTTACDLARSQLSRPLLLTLPKEAAEGPIHAVAETDRLQQVLLNLIENADKYSPPGRPIHLNLSQDADTLCISVQDQGIGIALEDIPKVFDRFHRGRNAIEHERGSGLGLSVVKLLVEAMGAPSTSKAKSVSAAAFTSACRRPSNAPAGAPASRKRSRSAAAARPRPQGDGGRGARAGTPRHGQSRWRPGGARRERARWSGR